MGGGLLQLVAYGAQDAYLTGNPQITFWKSMFKRHTNFAMEAFRVNFSGQSQWGTKQTAIIGRHADLLFTTYLQVELPRLGNDGSTPYYYNNDEGCLGFNLIKYTEIDIGGQVIDRLYGEWMFVWSSLTMDQTQLAKLKTLVGGAAIEEEATLLRNAPGCAPDGRQFLPNIFYIPLSFFFTKNPGAALPLIALQYHEVKINIYWNEPEMIAGNFNTVPVGNGAVTFPPISQLPSPTNAAIYIDYIYLDTEERRRMAQASHEYLIEQTQYNEEKGIVSANNKIDLTFNHPVKELVWVVQPTAFTNCRIASSSLYNPSSVNVPEPRASRLTPFSYVQINDGSPVFEQWLQINGQDRMDRRFGDYFSKVQTFQHHTGEGGAGIFSYSFALKPEEHQPSGTCNFSRIDTATLVMNMAGQAGGSPGTPGDPNFGKNPDFNNWEVRVYAINYNILRVMSGMAGLAYSN
jgi:hypothetical protein